ncbi:MAG: putative sulfate/molybdate transporter [Actinobacteria bacterium]|nr:putative sulfate/molybdate transporter [Actinomycetota bacterium]
MRFFARSVVDDRAAATRQVGSSRAGLLPVRFDRHELAGGVADIGIMIPLACGVAAVAHLSLVTVFVCVAAVYAVTALAFRVPVPVQPMKAMAAAIIALGLSASVVSAAGLEIGLLLLLFAVTPLARHLGRLFPRAVVRGIQLAIGILLLKSALVMAGAASAFPGLRVGLSVGGLTLSAGVIVALAIVAFLLIGRERQRLPGSLLVLGAGAVVGIVLVGTGIAKLPPVPASAQLPLLHLPSLHDAWIALFAVVLPQLPLSLGNSVFATDDVLHHYYGSAARRVTPASICLSLGLVNLATGLLGGMALCHGSGGATAHYRLGARTAGATLAAAGLYATLAAGAAFGLSPLFIPGAVLAGMLLFVGAEHCLLLTDLTNVDDIVCALLIALVAAATSDLAIGFLVGWAVFAVLKRTPLHNMRLRWPALTARLAPPPEPLDIHVS